jgi:hypothetical protein
MLAYRSFYSEQQHAQLQDIVISAIARLSSRPMSGAGGLGGDTDLQLEQKLAACVDKKYVINSTLKQQLFSDEMASVTLQISGEYVETKVMRLLEAWKHISSYSNFGKPNKLSMYDVYTHSMLTEQLATSAKLNAIYGTNEEALKLAYSNDSRRPKLCLCGSFEYERSSLCADYLEMLFRIGLDRTDNWNTITNSLNKTPLLPEFYSIIGEKNLSNVVDKQFIVNWKAYEAAGLGKLKSTSKRRHRTSLGANAHDSLQSTNRVKHRGLFRSYSIRSMTQSINEKTILNNSNKSLSHPSLSFSNKRVGVQEEMSTDESERNEVNEQWRRNRVIDYGVDYARATQLAVWLIKWSSRFDKLLLDATSEAGGMSSPHSFWYNGHLSCTSKTPTLRMQSLNANVLIGCAYLADGNDLHASLLLTESKLNKQYQLSSASGIVDDELTQISNLIEPLLFTPSVPVQRKDQNEDNSSTTLDISSLSENQIVLMRSPRFENNSVQEALKETGRRTNALVESMLSPRKEHQISNINKYAMPIGQPTTVYEAAEFYHLLNVRPDTSASTSRHESNQLKTIQLEPQVNLNDKYSINNKSRKSNRSRSKSSSKSPAPALTSLSPVSIKKDQNRAITFEQQTLTFATNHQQFPSTTESKTNVYQDTLIQQHSYDSSNTMLSMIRNELKAIVQLQHDTVMNFLNGGPNGSSVFTQQQQYPNQNQEMHSQMHYASRVEQQLTSVLRKEQHKISSDRGEPLEFIIETKIRTLNQEANDKINRPNDIKVNQSPEFLSSTPEIPLAKRQPLSIKIPLINLRTLSRATQEQQHHSRISQWHLPLINNEPLSVQIQQTQSNLSPPKRHYSPLADLAVLEFKSEHHIHSVSAQPPLLGLEKTDVAKTPWTLSKQSTSVAVNRYVEEKENQSNELNRHVREFVQMSAKQALSNYRNFPLLKFNYNQTEKLQTENSDAYRNHQQPIAASHMQTRFTQVSSCESKEIQSQKPLYDGYLLAPGLFEQMLNEADERASASNAHAHYKATQHIRDADEERKSDEALRRANKKNAYTNTEESKALQLAPDILLKLKFDSNRKDRQEESADTKQIVKDYVNVVDLQGDQVRDILNLIEYEQSRRQEKTVSASVKLKIEGPSQLESSQQSPNAQPLEKNDEIKPLVPPSSGDRLTENIFNQLNKPIEMTSQQYDELIRMEIERTNKLIAGDHRITGKQHIIDELKLIDERIRIMNEMAAAMSDDYAKYNRILGAVELLSKHRGLVEKLQREEKERDEYEKAKLEKKFQEERTTFYETNQAQEKVDDLKRNVVKGDSKHFSTRKKQKQQQQEKQREAELEIEHKLEEQKVDEEEELSELRSDEEKKLKRILKSSQTSITLETASSMSITDVFREVFDELDIESVGDLDSSLVMDEMIVKSSMLPNSLRKSQQEKKAPPLAKSETSPSRRVHVEKQEKENMQEKQPLQIKTAMAKLKPTKSPISTANNKPELLKVNLKNDQVKKLTELPIHKENRLNITFDKTSSNVLKDKQMNERRELVQEQNAQQREKDAKKLLQDMIIDNKKLKALQQQNSKMAPLSTLTKKKSTSPSPNRITKPTSKSPSRLVNLISDSNISQPLKIDVKPSLMTQTIVELQRKESARQSDVDQLLRSLEERASFYTNPDIIDQPNEIRLIKPFTELVHLQKPEKLHEKIPRSPVTYGQQLLMHQQNTVRPMKPSSNQQMVKIYGNRQAKATVMKKNVNLPRRQKTYVERLKDLKPTDTSVQVRPQSAVILSTGRANAGIIKTSHNSKPYTIRLGELQKNKTNLVLGKNSVNSVNSATKLVIQKRRYAPYHKPENEDTDALSDLSSWSLDDKIKGILYEEQNGQPGRIEKSGMVNKQRRVTYKDEPIVQDNLNGIGNNIIEDLLKDEKENEKAYENALKELKELPEGDRYVSQVDLEDLKNISLNSDSLSSYIDWDQIDNLTKTFK